MVSVAPAAATVPPAAPTDCEPDVGPVGVVLSLEQADKVTAVRPTKERADRVKLAIISERRNMDILPGKSGGLAPNLSTRHPPDNGREILQNWTSGPFISTYSDGAMEGDAGAVVDHTSRRAVALESPSMRGGSDPIEPPPSRVVFPDPEVAADEYGVLAVGVDYSPGTLLLAYRSGIFPWPQSPRVVPWVSPDPRTIFPLETPPRWSRSFRRTLRTHPYRLSIDEAFEDVVEACRSVRKSSWIYPNLIRGYLDLHKLGWAHSVEVWEKAEAFGDVTETLVGGIYGIACGATFTGESMFHKRDDTSKIAFAYLAEHLRARRFSLFDAQVMNPHLQSLGCVEIPRKEYLRRHAESIASGERFGRPA